MSWVCAKCGFAGPSGIGLALQPSEFPITCRCGSRETFEEAMNRNPDVCNNLSPAARRCRFLQGVKETFNGRWLSCGCSRTYLYPCQFFDELVTLHAIRPPNEIDTADDVRAAITDFYTDYQGRSCQGCQAFEPLAAPPPRHVQSIQRLNLIYHVCPLRNNAIWQDNLQQLLQRWGVFNGRKILAIATGDGLHCPEMVQLLINRPDAEYLLVPNDREVREVESFPALLAAIQSTDPAEATFYAHSKGNSTGDNVSGAWLWALAMYRHLLDQPQVIREALRTFAAVGTCKMVWPAGHHGPYPTQQPSVASQYVHLPGNWTFAGTFFWFRHDAIFTRNWSVARDRYAAEAWLAGILDEQRGLSLYQPWPVDQYPTPCPYDPQVHLGMPL